MSDVDTLLKKVAAMGFGTLSDRELSVLRQVQADRLSGTGVRHRHITALERIVEAGKGTR